MAREEVKEIKEIFESILDAKSQFDAYGIESTEYNLKVNKKFFDGLDMAVKALDRDTPKKVNIEQWIATECPNGCGYTLSTHHGDGYYSIDDKPTFCPLCGQRLDWREED